MKIRRRRSYGTQTLARDAHNPTQVFVETDTTAADKAIYERNQRIQRAGLMQQGQRNALGQEGAEITVAFQFPNVMAWQIAKAQHPQEFADLEVGGIVSERAGERLALLLPQFVTSIKRPDRRL